jgi:hypothetical protein
MLGKFLLLGALLFGSQLFAQELSTITGAATDASGAAVPNVKVIIINSGTGVVARSTVTNAAGIYTASEVAVGTYSLKAEAAGFKGFQLTGIVVNVHSTVEANIALNVGTTTDSVTVQADVVQVQSESNEVSNVISSEQIESISTNGRSPFKLQELVPGANSTLPSFTTPVNELNGGGCTACVSFSGERPYHNLYLVDGGEINDRGTGGSYDIEISQDALAEFKVISSNAEPEVGMASGGIVSMSIKSGTSKFHGAVWEFNRNTVFDANDYFAKQSSNKRPKQNYNLFGGDIGGPLYIRGKYNTDKQKTFFFYNIEDRRLILGQTRTSNTLPNTGRTDTAPNSIPTFNNSNYNFSGGVLQPIFVPNNQDATYNAKLTALGLTPGTPFPNNQIPAALIDPNVALYLNDGAIPKPNTSNGYQYFSATPLPTTVLNQNVRVDHSFSDKISLMGSFETDKGGFTSAPGWSNSSFQTVGTTFNTPSYATQIRLIETINKDLLNEVAFNWDKNAIAIVPFGTFQKPAGFNAGSFFTDILPGNRAPNISIGGNYGVNMGVSNYPWTNVYNNYEGKDNLHWTRGKHSMSFGGSYWRYTKLQQPFVNTQGGYGFNGNATSGTLNGKAISGDALADALLGFASSYSQSETWPTVLLEANALSFYGNDSWAVTPRLKLDIGLRWEFLPHVFDAHNHISNFNPALYNRALAPVFNSDTSMNTSVNFTKPTAPGAVQTPFYLNGIEIPGQNGVSSGIVNNYKTNFAPRVGFAYGLDAASKTVLRGGFGMFYERVEDGLSGIGNQEPFENNPSASNVYFSNPATSYLNGATASTPTYVQGLSTWAHYYPLPESIQYSLGVQRQLTPTSVLSIAYVGNSDYHQSAIPNINSLALSDTSHRLLNCGGNCGSASGFTDPYRNYPGFGDITEFQNIAVSRYSGLQAAFTLQTRHGLDVSGQYTWSHATDDGQGDNAGNPTNPYSLAYDKGNSAYDRRHVFSANYAYTLPFFNRSSNYMARTVLGGWQITGVVKAETGSPFNLSVNNNNIGLPGAGQRPDIVGKISYPKTLTHWFNPTVFARPANLTFGNFGRNQLYGPGLINFDTSIHKSIPLWPEGVKFEFNLDTYNTFNHLNPNNPASTNQGANDMGVINSDYAPRFVQLGAHLSF